MGKGANNVVPC